MKFNLPKNKTFWVAVAIAVSGMGVYAAHLVTQFMWHYVLHLQMIAFVLVSIGFVVLFLDTVVISWHKE